MVQINLKIKELEKIEEALDSVDFFLNINVTQEEEDKFFEDLSTLKDKIHIAIENQEKIGHIKDLIKMNELNFLTNSITLDKYLDEKNLMLKRIKEIKNKK